MKRGDTTATTLPARRRFAAAGIAAAAAIALAGLPATAVAGGGWSAPEPAGPGDATSLSCTSETLCTAVDADGHSLTFNGKTWGTPKSIDAGRYLSSLSCVGSSFCAAVDTEGRVVTETGGVWGTAVALGGSFTSVSCPSTTFCMAVESDGEAASYDGSSWSAPSDVDGSHKLASVSCSSASFCVAVDSEGDAVTFKGSSWGAAAAIDSSHQLTAVSCTSESFCAAVDGSGYAVVLSGSTWGTPVFADTYEHLNSVSCVSSSYCFAVDGFAHGATFDGSSWSEVLEVGILNQRGLRAVSCASAKFCVGVEGEFADTFNGSEWTNPTTVGGGVPDSLSCTSPTFCMSVDGVGTAVAFEGGVWKAPVDVGASEYTPRVSCASDSLCAVVGLSAGNAAIYNGSSWSAPTAIEAGEFASVSCPATSFCISLGSAGEVLFNGSTWSSLLPSFGASYAVSCPTSSFCAAVGGEDAATFPLEGFGGEQTKVDEGSVLTDVSCASSSFCVAVDDHGNALTFNGSVWSKPTDIDSAALLQSVSCASSTFCVAVGEAGRAVVFNGTTWGTPTDIDGPALLQAVSCPSAAFCKAVDVNNDAVTYDNGASPPRNTAHPTITGITQPGQTLTEHHGTWENEPSNYSYQWELCNSAGTGCSAIPLATGQTYVLTEAEIGDVVRVQESATNEGGTTGPVASKASGLVVKAGASPTTILRSWFTGGTLGGAGALTAEWTISGEEYAGDVDPLEELMLRLPTGSVFAHEGFETCSVATLETLGPLGCPAESRAGQTGEMDLMVSIGGERIPEEANVEAFFGEGGRFVFFVEGTTPVRIEEVMQGTYEPPTAHSGPGMKIEVPLIETLPGAPHASISFVELHFGATRTEGDHDVPSVTLPTCLLGETLAWGTQTGFEDGIVTEAPLATRCPASSITKVKSSTSTPKPGEAVTYTAVVSPAPFQVVAPYGEVVFFEDGEQIAGCELPLESGTETAVAQCQSEAKPGHHVVSARFSGDADYLGSTSEPATITGGGGSGGSETTTTTTTSHSVHTETTRTTTTTATTTTTGGPPEAPAPTPLLGQTQVAKPISGTVTVRVRGSHRFVPLRSTGSVPNGSEVEATNGHVLITEATPSGKTESAEVYGGRFVVDQEQKSRAATRFTLSLPLTGCPKVPLPHGSAASASASRHRSGPKSRRLWVSEHGGSWGTNGRYVSTSVEGTRWFTLDECERSEVKVEAGKVAVRDLVRNRTKVLSAGGRYVATRK